MRKLFGILTLALASVLVFSACNNNDDDEPGTPANQITVIIGSDTLTVSLEWDGGNGSGENDLDVFLIEGPAIDTINYGNDDGFDIYLSSDNSTGFEDAFLTLGSIPDGEYHIYILAYEATPAISTINWTMTISNGDQSRTTVATVTGTIDASIADTDGNFVPKLRVVKNGNNFTITAIDGQATLQ